MTERKALVETDDGMVVSATGSTLIVGPSGAGKTRLTARALQNWIDEKGTDGVVVLEFGPSIEHDGRLVGGRLDRFVDIPVDVFHGVLDAHAPRLEGETDDETHDLAETNAENARRLFEALPPHPVVVFGNDVTIPFQHESAAVSRLTKYCDRATCAVVNAYEGDALGSGDRVSDRERDVLADFRHWADHIVSLE